MYSYDEQKNTLSIIHKILEENDFLDKMHLAFGTFLGAVRQGKLNTSINNWDDIDFCVNEENFASFKDTVIPSLQKQGFEIKYVWMTSFNKIGEITFYRGSERLDINQVFPCFLKKEKYYLHCHWYGNIQLSKGLRSEYHEKIEKIILEDLVFYGPSNKEQYLFDCYGKNWKIPCTSEDEYKYWEDSPGVPWWNRTNFIKMLNEIPQENI